MSAIISNVIISLVSAIGGWLLKEFHIWYTDKKIDSAATEQQNAKTASDVDAASKDVSANF